MSLPLITSANSASTRSLPTLSARGVRYFICASVAGSVFACFRLGLPVNALGGAEKPWRPVTESR